MKKFLLDFEITAYLFIQERLRKGSSIVFDKDDLVTFVDTFCYFLNNKDYVVLTKLGEKIEKYEDYVAVASKICNSYTETICDIDTHSDKRGLDAMIVQYFFNEKTFGQISKAFNSISPEYLNLFAEFEAHKVKSDYLHKGRYNFENEMYKMKLSKLRKEEKAEQEDDEEENVALA